MLRWRSKVIVPYQFPAPNRPSHRASNNFYCWANISCVIGRKKEIQRGNSRMPTSDYDVTEADTSKVKSGSVGHLAWCLLCFNNLKNYSDCLGLDQAFPDLKCPADDSICDNSGALKRKPCHRPLGCSELLVGPAWSLSI